MSRERAPGVAGEEIFPEGRGTSVHRLFPRWVFGEFYGSLKFVRNFPRSTHMFIYMLESKKAWDKDESTIKEFEEGQ